MAVGGGKCRSIIETKPNRRVLRGGWQEMNNEQIPMSSALEVKGGGRRFARRSKTRNLFLCRPHLQSNTDRRLCQGVNCKYFFDATLLVQSRKFFKFFRKSLQNMIRVVAFKAGRQRESERRQRDVFDSGDIGIFSGLCKQTQAVTVCTEKNFFASPIKRLCGVFNMRKKMTLFPKPNSPPLQYGADGDAGRSVFLRSICR